VGTDAPDTLATPGTVDEALRLEMAAMAAISALAGAGELAALSRIYDRLTAIAEKMTAPAPLQIAA
jgi:hypothetical protein